MKFVTFLHNGGQRVGIIDPERAAVWPIADLVPEFTENLLDLVRGFDEIKNFLTPTDDGIPVNDVSLCAPISRPERNILCVGKNYLEHSKEFQASGFDQSSGPRQETPQRHRLSLPRRPPASLRRATQFIGILV